MMVKIKNPNHFMTKVSQIFHIIIRYLPGLCKAHIPYTFLSIPYSPRDLTHCAELYGLHLADTAYPAVLFRSEMHDPHQSVILGIQIQHLLRHLHDRRFPGSGT